MQALASGPRCVPIRPRSLQPPHSAQCGGRSKRSPLRLREVHETMTQPLLLGAMPGAGRHAGRDRRPDDRISATSRMAWSGCAAAPARQRSQHRLVTAAALRIHNGMWMADAVVQHDMDARPLFPRFTLPAAWPGAAGAKTALLEAHSAARHGPSHTPARHGGSLHRRSSGAASAAGCPARPAGR